MEVFDRNEKTDFVLFEGTDAPLTVTWPTGMFPIAEFAPVVDHELNEKLLRVFDSQPHTRGFAFIVHGIRIGWIFTAMEAARTKTMLDNAQTEIADLRQRLDELEKILRTNGMLR